MLIIAMVCILADPKSRFESEYSSEIKELQRTFSDVRGIAIVNVIKNGGKAVPTSYHFACGSGRRKVDFDRLVLLPSGKSILKSYGYAEIDGRNIEVVRAGPTDPFSVRGIGDEDPMRVAAFNAIFGDFLNAPWGFGGYEISEAFAKGWLSITEAHEIEESGRTLIEVTFRQTTTTKPTYYRAVFDPTLHWAIARASQWDENPDNPSDRYEATYSPTASGSFYLKSIHRWGRSKREQICEFDQVEFKQTPVSEFTLEFYGLKSPPLPQTGPNYKLIAAVLTAAVLLLFGAWLTRRLAIRHELHTV